MKYYRCVGLLILLVFSVPVISPGTMSAQGCPGESDLAVCGFRRLAKLRRCSDAGDRCVGLADEGELLLAFR